MKRTSLLLMFAFALTACAQATPLPTSTALPTASASPAPTETLTPTVTLTPEPTANATATLTRTPHPGLVFVEPILAAVVDVKPVFADDFSKNRGWISGQHDEIGIKDGVVWASGKGGIFFPPKVQTFPDYKNVVLAFDLRLSKVVTVFDTYLRAGDHGRGYQFSLNGEGNWNFNIGTELASGTASHFRLGELNHIVIVAQDDQFAVLINDRLTMYVRNGTYPKAGSCVMIAFNSRAGHVSGELDNLQLWDLDKLPKP